MKEAQYRTILCGLFYIAHQVTPGDWMFAAISMLAFATVVLINLREWFPRKEDLNDWQI